MLETAPSAVALGLHSDRWHYQYDHQGRRVHMRHERKDTNGDWQFVTERIDIYDGWNHLLSLENHSAPGASPQLANRYLWGPDLSGSLQGAGGVGGLLALEVPTTQGPEILIPGYDGNGNIMALWDKNHQLKAAYEYSPFGRVLKSSGHYAKENPYRFSTKYQDDETGYFYYGFRYYDPETGRWPNRDPIQERGGVNLYGFIRNRIVDQYDILGLAPPTPTYKHQAVTGLGYQDIGVAHQQQHAIRKAVIGPGSIRELGVHSSITLKENWAFSSEASTSSGYEVTLDASKDYKVFSGKAEFTFSSTHTRSNATSFSQSVSATYTITKKEQLYNMYKSEWKVYQTEGCILALACGEGDVELSSWAVGFQTYKRCADTGTIRKKGAGTPITPIWLPTGEYKLARDETDLTGWSEDLDLLENMRGNDFVNFAVNSIVW